MNLWKRIIASLVIISLSLGMILLIMNLQISTESTGYFILKTGSGVAAVLGICLLLVTLFQIAMEEKAKKKRKTEELTEEKIGEDIYKRTSYVDEENIEGKLLFEAGSIAAYLKKRGISRGGITAEGEYRSYVTWANALKRSIRNFIERHPKLLRGSYSLELLQNIDPLYAGKVLEELAHAYEEHRRLGLSFIPKKSLKTLSYKLKKYVRKE